MKNIKRYQVVITEGTELVYLKNLTKIEEKGSKIMKKSYEQPVKETTKKEYKVSIKDWNEAIPDENIWDNEAIQEYIEAESREEALQIAMDYIMDCINGNNGKWVIDDEEEREYEKPCEINMKDETIDYINEDGYNCSIVFKVEEAEE